MQPDEQQTQKEWVPDDPEVRTKRELMRVEYQHQRALMALERERAQLNALGPEMLARIAWATELARSELVPPGFRNPASILVAQDMGEALGVRGAAVFQALQVVEGQCGLKPDFARGRLIEAGYDIEDEEHENRHGFPVAATVTVSAPDYRAKSVTYKLARALRGGMLDSVILADGTAVTSGPFNPDDVVDVRARSFKGKAKPWETATGNMLRHGADREYIRRYALHITGGMVPLVGGFREDEEVEVRTVRATAERATDPAPPEPPRGAIYDPHPDVELIREKTGSGDWRKHAGAVVRRRTKVQQAADRLAEWAAGDPDKAAWLLGEEVSDPEADGHGGSPRETEEYVETVEDAVLLNPPPGVEHPTVTAEPSPGTDQWWSPEELEKHEQAANARQREMRELWDRIYDLIGDDRAARSAVLSWVHTNPVVVAELPDNVQWQELPAAVLAAYLNAMEGVPDA